MSLPLSINIVKPDDWLTVAIAVVYRALPLGLRDLVVPAPGGQTGQQSGLGAEAETEHELQPELQRNPNWRQINLQSISPLFYH